VYCNSVLYVLVFYVLFDVQSSIELLYPINHFSFFRVSRDHGMVCIGCTSVVQCERTVVLRSAEMRNFSAADCGKATRGNLRNIPHLIFRILPLDNFPQSAFRKIPAPDRDSPAQILKLLHAIIANETAL